MFFLFNMTSIASIRSWLKDMGRLMQGSRAKAVEIALSKSFVDSDCNRIGQIKAAAARAHRQ